MRAPVVAGVGGGVGTTTVAVGLRGHDAGRLTGLPPGHRPDILVCRATFDSLQRAAAVLAEADPAPPPVLAVTLPDTRPARGPLRTWLERLEADTAGLVLLPHVRRWGMLVDPLAEVAQLLVEPATQLPRPLRAYAAALRELAAAVANSGRLGRSFDEQHLRLGRRAVRQESPRPPATGAAVTGFGPSSDDRHTRRPGSAERAIRGTGSGFARPTADSARPTTAGAFPPVERLACRGAAGLVPADPTPRGPGPQRRQGVRIVPPDRLSPAGTRRTGALPDDPRPGRQGAPVPAEQVG